MKTQYKIQDLNCAYCVAKMKNAINKLTGVNHAAVSFMTQRLIIDAEDSRFDATIKEVVKICRRVEPGCTI